MHNIQRIIRYSCIYQAVRQYVRMTINARVQEQPDMVLPASCFIFPVLFIHHLSKEGGHMRTRIRAAYIIANRDGHNVVCRNAEMIYEDNTIVSIGHDTGCADQTIDFGNSIISPGFVDINALGDIDHSLFYSEIDAPEKMYWSREYYDRGVAEEMTPEEEDLKSLYAYSQLISHGITTAVPITCTYYKRDAETYEEIEAAARNAKHLGLRVYLGPSFLDHMQVYDRKKGSMSILPLPQGREGLDRAERFVLECEQHPDELITPIMVPERIEYQSPELIQETWQFATQHGILMRLHAAQSSTEYSYIQEHYHESPIAFLQDLGVLGNSTIIPHALFTSGSREIPDKGNADLDILRKHGISIVHCPLIYSRNGQALESFGRFVRSGINMCMGSDTYPCDFFDIIRTGKAFADYLDHRAPENSYRSFFEAATLGGARALHRSDIGRLAVGAKADFFVLNLDAYDIGVCDDPIRTMLMNAHSQDITYVVINGRTVLRGGRIPGFDYAAVRADAQRYYEKLRGSFIHRSAFPEEGFYQPVYPG